MAEADKAAAPVQHASAKPPATMTAGTKRPAVVALLLLSDILAGIFLVAIGLLGALASTGATSTFGVFLTILGIYSIVVAWGYSKAESWIWWPGIVHGAIVLALGVLITVSGVYLYGVPALLLGGWTVYQLTRGKAKSFLGRG